MHIGTTGPVNAADRQRAARGSAVSAGSLPQTRSQRRRATNPVTFEIALSGCRNRPVPPQDGTDNAGGARQNGENQENRFDHGLRSSRGSTRNPAGQANRSESTASALADHQKVGLYCPLSEGDPMRLGNPRSPAAGRMSNAQAVRHGLCGFRPPVATPVRWCGRLGGRRQTRKHRGCRPVPTDHDFAVSAPTATIV